MKRGILWGLLTVVVIAAVASFAACGGGDEEADEAAQPAPAQEETGPIVIGAAVDLTGNMSFFDGPALTAAQIRVEEINAQGGVNGRKLEIKVVDHQLDPEKGKAAAADLVSQGAVIGWVTCDVDWATPAAQEFLNGGLLTVAPCIGTDQMGPKRFGEKGELAFSFGNVAQDEGAAMAEWAIGQGYKTAVTVRDNVIVYFQDVVKAFEARFKEKGGKIIKSEGFTQGDGTVQNVISSVTRTDADVIALSTFADDLAAFVAGVRSAGNDTPMICSWACDGAFWVPKKPKISGFNFVTFASSFGDDPSSEVQSLIEKMKAQGNAPATGAFVTGAAAIEAIVSAIEKAGTTDGAKLAEAFESFQGLDTISGKVSFSDELHTVFGREYRLVTIDEGQVKYVELVKASAPAEIG